MSKPQSRTCIGVVLLALATLCASGGLALADPVPLPDVAQSGATVDQWHLNLSLTNMTINAVPNMAATAFVKEGFVSATVTAAIDGDGAVAVNSGTLVLGVQIGCRVNLSEGLDLGIGNSYDVVSNSPYLNLTPNISTTLKPGAITTLGLGKKPLKGRLGVISVRDAHVQVDGCGGGVTTRLFASVVMSTDQSDDSLNAYGDIEPL